jgi:hypothetical protein
MFSSHRVLIRRLVVASAIVLAAPHAYADPPAPGKKKRAKRAHHPVQTLFGPVPKRIGPRWGDYPIDYGQLAREPVGDGM